MSFFAIIGIIAILYIGKKIFDALGNTFESMSQTISNNFVSRTYTKIKPIKPKNVKEKINTIRGNGTDQEYMDKVRDEIDELLK